MLLGDFIHYEIRSKMFTSLVPILSTGSRVLELHYSDPKLGCILKVRRYEGDSDFRTDRETVERMGWRVEVVGVYMIWNNVKVTSRRV